MLFIVLYFRSQEKMFFVFDLTTEFLTNVHHRGMSINHFVNYNPSSSPPALSMTVSGQRGLILRKCMMNIIQGIIHESETSHELSTVNHLIELVFEPV